MSSDTLKLSHDMETFLALNFHGYLDYIYRNGHEWDHLKDNVRRVLDNPERMREIDYGRFLKRVCEMPSHPDFPAWISYFHSLSMLNELHALYLTIAREKNIKEDNLAAASLEPEILALQPIDQIFLGLEHSVRNRLPKPTLFNLWGGSRWGSTDFLFLNFQLDRYGLCVEDIEGIFRHSAQNAEAVNAWKNDEDARQTRAENIQTHFPYSIEKTDGYMDEIGERLGGEPHKRDLLRSQRKKLLEGYSRVREAYNSGNGNLGDVLDREFQRVRKLMAYHNQNPLQKTPLVDTDEFHLMMAVSISHGVQAMLVKSFAEYLSKWKPKLNESGLLVKLEGYEENPDKAYEFEAMRYATMYGLSQSTMESQSATRRLDAMHPKGKYSWINDSDIKLVTPQDLEAYARLFFMLRAENIRQNLILKKHEL